MRPTFLPWMIAVKGKMVRHLNQKSYSQYGELKLHECMYVYMHVIDCNVLRAGNSNLDQHG